MDKVISNAVLDIESLTSQADVCCSGSPKTTAFELNLVYPQKVLSRKGSIRLERRIGEEQEADDSSKKIVVKVVASQMEQLKQPIALKTLQTTQSIPNNPVFPDVGEGRSKRLNRLSILHPRKILLFFATMSSLGTLILIYFTLTINRRGGD